MSIKKTVTTPNTLGMPDGVAKRVLKRLRREYAYELVSVMAMVASSKAQSHLSVFVSILIDQIN